MAVTNTGTSNFGTIFGDFSSPGTHTLATQGHSLTFSGTGAVCGDDILTTLSGSGALAVNLSHADAGINVAAANSGYSGALSVTNGVLETTDPNGFGSTSGVTVSGSGTLGLEAQGDNTYGFPISLGGSGDSAFLGTLDAGHGIIGCGGGAGGAQTATISGAVTLTSDIVYSGNYNAKITGTFTSNGHQITVVSGAQGSITTPQGTILPPATTTTVASGDNQPNTSVAVSNNQTYIIDGIRGATFVSSGGILKGTGQVGQLDVNTGGIVAPGHSPGCLTVNGSLTLNGTYQAEIGGTTPCTGYDQLKVTNTSGNTVDLTGGTLAVSLYGGFKPAAGQTYTIIDNGTTAPVSGTFSNLAEGATFNVSGYVFKISYKGGDGNDVVLTVVSVPATPNTGFALIKSNPLASMGAMVVAGGGLMALARRSRKPMKAAARR